MYDNDDSEHYWNIAGFLSDEEVNAIWDIIDNALDRKGFGGMADNGELSIRIFDDNLRQNIGSHTECEPEPCGTTHPLFYEF